MEKGEFYLGPNQGKALYIVEYPFSDTFSAEKPINFYGLAAKVIDDTTGLNEYVDDPWVEHEPITGPGLYTAYVYVDKDHTGGLRDSFRFRVI